MASGVAPSSQSWAVPGPEPHSSATCGHGRGVTIRQVTLLHIMLWITPDDVMKKSDPEGNDCACPRPAFTFWKRRCVLSRILSRSQNAPGVET